MERWLHNISGGEKTYRGVPIADTAFYKIELANLGWYQTSDDVITDLGNDDIRMSSDGATDYSATPASNVAYLLNAEPTPVDSEGHPSYFQSSFTSKKTEDGKKLYKRLMGMQKTLVVGANTFIGLTVGVAHAKMVGLKIIGGELLDYTDVKILDDASGTYSGTANLMLNQYGFSCNIAKDLHEESCPYDADLYYGMQIQFVYNSQSAKTIGINLDLNEVKA